MTVQRGADTSGIQEELSAILLRAAGLSPAAVADAGDRPLQDLGVESLAAMELQAAVKDRYQVLIPDELLGMSFAEIIQFVDARRGKKA